MNKKNNKKFYKLIKVFSFDLLNVMYYLCDILMCYIQVIQGSDMFFLVFFSVVLEGSLVVFFL